MVENFDAFLRQPSANAEGGEEKSFRGGRELQVLGVLGNRKWWYEWDKTEGDGKDEESKRSDYHENHPLDPKMATELFKSTGLGVLRFQQQLCSGRGRNWKTCKKCEFKHKWHLPLSTASEKFIFSTSQGGLGYPVPIPIIAPELARIWEYEDVSKQFTEEELEEAK